MTDPAREPRPDPIPPEPTRPPLVLMGAGDGPVCVDDLCLPADEEIATILQPVEPPER
ncbi:MAG TPA: hypothetical protein VFL03_03065 [Candidatus Limnocylindrales bacterium]|nr:hypothetical protein [Candidatus Limnocylindrales bacterium]